MYDPSNHQIYSIMYHIADDNTAIIQYQTHTVPSK